MEYETYYLNLLQKMISIPSVSGDEKNIAVFLADFLRKDLGMETELTGVKDNQYNLVARKTGSTASGRKLLLGGHIDTVAPSEKWSINPFSLTIKGNRAYGLGSCDMKGGLAAQITVLKRIIEEGMDFDGEIELVGVCDEERFSLGANDYTESCRTSGRKADFGIFAEPHFDNIVVGAAGKILLKIEVTGRTGHAANPGDGINAVDCLAAFITEVNRKYTPLFEAGECSSHCFLRLETEYSGYSLNIPEKASALLNKHLFVQESEEAFLDDLRTIYNEKVGIGTLRITRELPHYPSYVLDTNNSDYQLLRGITETTCGARVEERIGKGVTDGNVIYPELDIPIVMFGPKGVNLHQPDEYLCLDTVYTYMDILYNFINSFFSASKV